MVVIVWLIESRIRGKWGSRLLFPIFHYFAPFLNPQSLDILAHVLVLQWI